MDSAVVCLEGDFKVNVRPYVMLSRLTNGAAMGILGKWKLSLWSSAPDSDMLDFLRGQIYPKEQQTLADMDFTTILTMEATLREHHFNSNP